MAEMIISDSLEVAQGRNPHLKAYLDRYRANTQRTPTFIPVPDNSLRDLASIDIIYPVGDPIFIHINLDEFGEKTYTPIEPNLTDEEDHFMDEVLNLILAVAADYPPPENDEVLESNLDEIYKKKVSLGTANKIKGTSATVTPELNSRLLYNLKKNVMGLGPIEPLIMDSNIEDISGIGAFDIFIVHKIFGTLRTRITFGNNDKLSLYSKRLSERVGRPVSDKTPIVDATLPDGSRLSIVYSSDVSARGPSFTIRKFADIPISMVQLVKYNTLSAEEAAYLWLALEYGQSIFVCGETASGKTTVINAMIPFIRPESKIFSAEDTPEIRAPQPAWQQLVTRERGAEDSRVTLYDLLRTALRSRPNYIIVGEIRGAEGAMAFQAMQTGHPVLSTFHASSVKKMIQRFTGTPINIPVTFMDNLNIALIQQAVYVNGRFLRRTTSINEIEGYFEELGGVSTKQVFQWDPTTDQHVFRGLNNSYILEKRIAQTAGMRDPKAIYDELFKRTRIIEGLIRKNVNSYYDVFNITKTFYIKGEGAISALYG
ncbi:type II/IV secretion system ATPase subunit [Oxyplasma meridianum]|uniref:Type II/IV secretion system ATPase subunit n=1 Tax=Oxyplasma meridianum TaxID=3073602 RepID=A0AAX4NED2_9ARCH